MTEVFDTPGSVSLQIKLPSGRVVITTAEEQQTIVELVPLGRRGPDAVELVQVTAEERGGRHLVTIEEKDRIRWGPIRVTWGTDVEVRVTCPPGTNLELSGGSIELRAEGRLGEADVRTASGDIRLGDVDGRLQVKTASGDVEAGTVGSGGSIVTVSGDVEIDRLDGTLHARAVSGDFRLGAVSALVTLATTSGDVDLRSIDAGEARVQTVSGDVRIGVAPGTRVWIDASAVSGDLHSELGLADQAPEGEAEGTAAGALVPLHVKTVSGDVALVRAAAPVR